MRFTSLVGQMALLAGVMLLVTVAFAAPPQTINYQGYLKNTAGTPVTAATNLTFSIYSSASGAGAIWSETKSITPANGIYSTRLGNVTPLTLGFGRQLYLGVKVESDPEMRPLQPLTSVPSAYRAAQADSVTNNSIGTGAIVDGSVTSSKIADGAVTDVKITGTISGGKLGQHTHQAGDLPGTVLFSDTAQTISGVKTFFSPIMSTLSTGSAPLQVSSTTQVNNLNAEMVGGKKLSDLNAQYAPASAIAAPIQYPRSNTITTVDSSGNVGYDTSITIGSDGLPVISYIDTTNSDLKVAKCGNAACSSGTTITTIDSIGNKFFSSIAIGSDGLTVISYYYGNNGDLMVAKCGNADCSSGNIITSVDSSSDSVGWYTSITIGSDGRPVISYYDYINQNLKVAKCGNSACSSGNTITTVDSSGDVGYYTSITIGSDGLPVVSYFDATNGDLKVAKCTDAACSGTPTITTIDSSSASLGWFTSITIGSDGLPVISYYDSTNAKLKVAKCGNAACSIGNTITTIGGSGSVGQHTSITIGSDGLPVISYYDIANGDLKMAKCANAACSIGTNITTIEWFGDVGRYTSITIGTDGLPVISYYDYTNGDLKVAKCANQFCLNNWSRR